MPLTPPPASPTPVLIICQEFALGVISAPREAATGFPRLCYAYFSFAMTQCVGFSRKENSGHDEAGADDEHNFDQVGLKDLQVECGSSTGARGWRRVRGQCSTL